MGGNSTTDRSTIRRNVSVRRESSDGGLNHIGDLYLGVKSMNVLIAIECGTQIPNQMDVDYNTQSDLPLLLLPRMIIKSEKISEYVLCQDSQRAHARIVASMCWCERREYFRCREVWQQKLKRTVYITSTSQSGAHMESILCDVQRVLYNTLYTRLITLIRSERSPADNLHFPTINSYRTLEA